MIPAAIDEGDLVRYLLVEHEHEQARSPRKNQQEAGLDPLSVR